MPRRTRDPWQSTGRERLRAWLATLATSEAARLVGCPRSTLRDLRDGRAKWPGLPLVARLEAFGVRGADWLDAERSSVARRMAVYRQPTDPMVEVSAAECGPEVSPMSNIPAPIERWLASASPAMRAEYDRQLAAVKASSASHVRAVAPSSNGDDAPPVAVVPGRVAVSP